nr:O-antigen ligase family protein [Pseudoduganella umbonata]
MGMMLQVAVFMGLLGLGNGSGEDGNRSRQLLWGLLGTTAIIYMVISKLLENKRRFSFGGWPLVLILAYVCVSAAWSVDQSATIKRSVLLLLLVSVCCVSAGAWRDDWNKDTWSKLLASPLLCLVGISLLVTIITPGRAFTELGWRGIASHKNEAGQMMAISTILFLYGVCHEKLTGRMRFGLVLVTFTCLIMAKSTTALLGLMIGVGLTELITIRSSFRRLGTWQLAIIAIILISSCLLFFGFQLDLLPSVHSIYLKFLAALGKSDTFTGRTEIWELVLGESRFHNPWLGGGYGAFWSGRDGISGYVILGSNLYPGQAHNGYVDIYNDLGILGLSLMIVVLLAGLYQARRLAVIGHPEAKLHLAILFMCIFLNLGESTFLRTTTFTNVVFLASFIRTAAIARQSRVYSKGSPLLQ